MAVTDHRDLCVGRLALEYAQRIEQLGGLMPFGAPNHYTPEERVKVEAFNAPLGPVRFGDVRAEDTDIEGLHGPIPLRVYTPLTGVEANSPALVWMHGGAFMGGSLDMPEADHTARYVCFHGRLPVISVDYRLAKDGIHYPTPEDDVVAAYLWAADGASGLSVDAHRVAIGGASAGACLAASACLRLRDAGRVPWQALLAYPKAHQESVQPSPELDERLAQLPPALQPDPGFGRLLAENYLGTSGTRTPAYAFPGDNFDLTGFPPTLIENCEFDDLRASGERFAAQLAEAGADVEQRCAPGVLHGHLNLVGSPYAYATMHHFVDRLRDGRY